MTLEWCVLCVGVCVCGVSRYSSQDHESWAPPTILTLTEVTGNGESSGMATTSWRSTVNGSRYEHLCPRLGPLLPSAVSSGHEGNHSRSKLSVSWAEKLHWLCSIIAVRTANELPSQPSSSPWALRQGSTPRSRDPLIHFPFIEFPRWSTQCTEDWRNGQGWEPVLQGLTV